MKCRSFQPLNPYYVAVPGGGEDDFFALPHSEVSILEDVAHKRGTFHSERGYPVSVAWVAYCEFLKRNWGVESVVIPGLLYFRDGFGSIVENYLRQFPDWLLLWSGVGYGKPVSVKGYDGFRGVPLTGICIGENASGDFLSLRGVATLRSDEMVNERLRVRE